jgi:hypothetical protein
LLNAVMGLIIVALRATIGHWPGTGVAAGFYGIGPTSELVTAIGTLVIDASRTPKMSCGGQRAQRGEHLGLGVRPGVEAGVVGWVVDHVADRAGAGS